MVWTSQLKLLPKNNVSTLNKRSIKINWINRLHHFLTPAQPVCADWNRLLVAILPRAGGLQSALFSPGNLSGVISNLQWSDNTVATD